MAPAGQVISLPVLRAGLPAAPPSELDPYLDAAARCLARHGVGRTSVQDVARELGVNRTTVYRQIGSVDDMVRLLLAREVHALVDVAEALDGGRPGPTSVVRFVAATVRYARHHPIISKVLADEPELIGPFVVTYLPDIVRLIADQVAPALEGAMSGGTLAHRDPASVAEWLVRVGVTLIIAPLPDDKLEPFLAELLTPALRKETK
jgi:AcrR family transcriptional regulator